MESVFIAYSHKDEELRNELEAHLSLMKREGSVSVWHDRRLVAGTDLNKGIDQHLRSDSIILLLVSADFVNSEYIWNVELKAAMARHDAGDAKVIPVILRPCDWKTAPFGKLVAVPTDGRPVTLWPNRDAAYVDIVEHVRRALAEMNSKHPSSKGRTASAASSASEDPLEKILESKRDELIKALAATAGVTSSPRPRSSNLRIRRDFTDAEKDTFLDEAYDYIVEFFEGSLFELKQRNRDVDFNFKRIDAHRFEAALYRHGKQLARCRVVLRGPHGGIAYSGNPQQGDSSANEILRVDSDDQHLFLHPSFGFDPEDVQMPVEAAAEHLWARFIERLQ